MCGVSGLVQHRRRCAWKFDLSRKKRRQRNHKIAYAKRRCRSTLTLDADREHIQNKRAHTRTLPVRTHTNTTCNTTGSVLPILDCAPTVCPTRVTLNCIRAQFIKTVASHCDVPRRVATEVVASLDTYCRPLECAEIL